MTLYEVAAAESLINCNEWRADKNTRNKRIDRAAFQDKNSR
jgi:hypothetical protein